MPSDSYIERVKLCAEEGSMRPMQRSESDLLDVVAIGMAIAGFLMLRGE